MSARPCRLAAAVAALFLAGRASATFDLQLTLGASYWRGDSSSSATPAATSSAWDFSGGAGAQWTPLSPGLLVLSGTASYTDRTTAHYQVTDRIQNLTYAGGATVGTGPFTLSLTAGRSQTDFSTGGDAPQSGTTRADSYSAALAFTTAILPQVRVGWFHSAQTVYFTGAPDSRTDVDTLSVSLFHNVPTHGYVVGYNTSWSSGTRAQTNYQNHSLSISAEAHPSPGTTVSLSDTYYLRDPTVSDPSNPRLDANSIGLRVGTVLSPKVTLSAGYGYTRSLGQAPGTLDQENSAHSLSANADYRLDQHWSLVGAAGAGYSMSRLDAQHYQSTTESLSLGGTWNGALSARTSLTLSTTGSLGLSQPSEGPQLTTWGVGGSAFYGFPISSWDGNAGYTISYSDGSGALLASTLSQILSASASGVAWAGARASARLQAQSVRASSPVAGTSYGRNINLTGTLGWKANLASLSAGASDSLANDLTSGFSDGLFIPPSFNNRSRYVALSGQTAFDFRLSLGAALSYSWTSPAGGVTTDETALQVSAGYIFGMWTLSLVDTFTYSSVSNGTWTTSNNVFLRLGRSFSFHR